MRSTKVDCKCNQALKPPLPPLPPQVWASALKPDSVLLAPATAAKLPADDAPLAAELAGVLLTQQGARMGGEVSVPSSLLPLLYPSSSSSSLFCSRLPSFPFLLDQQFVHYCMGGAPGAPLLQDSTVHYKNVTSTEPTEPIGQVI